MGTVVHLYKHNVTPCFSDTGGFWAIIDETGKYKGRTYRLQDWETKHQARLCRGIHPEKCPPEIRFVISRATNEKEYSVYWCEDVSD